MRNAFANRIAQALDTALIGRFAIFLYPPDALQMDEADRIKVTTHIGNQGCLGDDAPSLSEWTEGETAGTVARTDVESVGDRLRERLGKAGTHFLRLRNQMSTLAEFPAKFADLLVRETGGEVALSKAWTDLVAGDAASPEDITLLAYTALQVEARRPAVP